MAPGGLLDLKEEDEEQPPPKSLTLEVPQANGHIIKPKPKAFDNPAYLADEATAKAEKREETPMETNHRR